MGLSTSKISEVEFRNLSLKFLLRPTSHNVHYVNKKRNKVVLAVSLRAVKSGYPQVYQLFLAKVVHNSQLLENY